MQIQGPVSTLFHSLYRYPLAITKDLDPERPTAATLLGIPVVIWRDGKGDWNCFEDRCPHRYSIQAAAPRRGVLFAH